MGPVPSTRGPIPSIRVHWVNFVKCVAAEHQRRNDEVHVLELPLWQFTPELVHEHKPDIVYVPHKERHAFPIDDSIDTRYYMQSVFPWRFYVDKKGFAGGASTYPCYSFVMKGDESQSDFDKLREYSLAGGTKFDQPPSRNLNLPENYVLFPCQIPHDETIKHHSDVTVERALEETCQLTNMMNVPLIVKGHPVNPSSMVNLKNICAKYANAIWVDDINIHDLIHKARVVVVVNSGTGMESLLHMRPVITFGRCEYDVVTMNAEIGCMGNIRDMIKYPIYNLANVKRFFNSWCKWTYDTQTPSDFNKLA